MRLIGCPDESFTPRTFLAGPPGTHVLANRSECDSHEQQPIGDRRPNPDYQGHCPVVAPVGQNQRYGGDPERESDQCEWVTSNRPIEDPHLLLRARRTHWLSLSRIAGRRKGREVEHDPAGLGPDALAFPATDPREAVGFERGPRK